MISQALLDTRKLVANCPWQWKLIADAVGQYAHASSLEAVQIRAQISQSWGFGDYWSTAEQLLHPSVQSSVASVLKEKKDVRQACHALVVFFIEQQQPVNPNTVLIAEMDLV
mgnify:CR=1 FL=1